MSTYTNFIQDFPKRCIEILDKYLDQAKANDREVTLMLCIATAAFVIPFERLRPPEATHPADDVVKFPKARKKYSSATNSRFILSHRWGQGRSWQAIDAVDGKLVRGAQVDYWARPEMRQPLSQDRIADSVFTHIRNALTHGSVFTYPAYSGHGRRPQIETILFVSQRYQKQDKERCGQRVVENVPIDKYDVLLVSPSDFVNFLRKWVEFLGSLDLVTTVTQASILILPEEKGGQGLA